ncbi:MAG: YhjD/YihY/BrkB family envelope integrity protein, partial [Chlamydiota bacterium]
GGLFAGCLYVILQWGYIYFQIGVNRFGAIYGSMAALPLFLIWLQLSWFLLLFGAEISHAHQTLADHEFEESASQVSFSFKRIVSLWIVHLTVNRFLKREAPLSLELLTKFYQLPRALVIPLLKELVDCHLLVEVKGGYIPGRPIEELRISDVFDALESRGISDFPFIHSRQLAPFADLMDQFREQIEKSPLNILVHHVPHSL